MADLCEGGNEPASSLKAISDRVVSSGSYIYYVTWMYKQDSQMKIAAPFKRFGEANISEIEFQKFQLHTEPRPQIVSSTELLSIVRSRNMFAFSSDERAFNIESYFRTVYANVL
ncbi:hypothetical protein ANN_09219 [Periplaneta americana]|uniref:Uncharacterized protein n=1 Tax=Periplaneta americana TaxID=6978 RepID=A0ABQ8TMH6_PERAM|nr:hypothetical protein ANN_09219 [Periplaneta americana]